MGDYLLLHNFSNRVYRLEELTFLRTGGQGKSQALNLGALWRVVRPREGLDKFKY